MLFGKKKQPASNPYYTNVVTKQGPQDKAAAPSQQQPGQIIGETDQSIGPMSVPLLPAPEPINIPNVELEPLKLSGRVSAIDMMRMGSETKAFAFVKLSDFKRIVDDIRSLEKRISESQEDLDEFSKLLKEQDEYLGRYGLVIKDLKKIIEEIASSLSKIED